MKYDSAVEEQAACTLRAILERLPDVAAQEIALSRASGYSPDLAFDVRSSRDDFRIIVEVKGRALPTEIRAVAAKVREYADRQQVATYPAIIAPRITPGAAEVIETAGVGWLDLAGNCELRLPGFLIRIRGNKSTNLAPRPVGSPFGARSGRVLTTLLESPGKGWRLTELAKAAGISLGQTHKVISAGHEQGWLEASRADVRLTRPDEMLEAWTRAYRPPLKVHAFSLAAPEEFTARLVRELPECALTGFAAAALYAPWVRSPHIEFYAPSELTPGMVRALDLRSATRGANVEIYHDPEAEFGARTVSGVRVVSPVRAYLDLATRRGRGREAAEHLRDELLLRGWR